MTSKPGLGLLLLHALPLDGSMWRGQADLLPGSTYTPTLYSCGDTLQAWAAAALRLVRQQRFIIVGCSVGGSCALEVAALAPERVAAMVLVGTKADLRPDPQLHAAALDMISKHGLDAAWDAFWSPLFSQSTDSSVLDAARKTFGLQSPSDIARGVTAFHRRASRGDVLSTFPGPVTIVCGEEDTAPGLEVSARQASQTRRGSLIVVPDCGHYVPMEKPALFNDVLRQVISMQLALHG